MSGKVKLQVIDTPTIYVNGPNYKVRCAVFSPLGTEIALKFNGSYDDFEVLGPTIGYSASCQPEMRLLHFGRLTEGCARLVKETLKKDALLEIYDDPKLNNGKLVLGVNI